MVMPKNVRLNDWTYDHVISKNKYHESFSDTVDRLLGIKEPDKEKSKK
jgi:hypothetical protein